MSGEECTYTKVNDNGKRLRCRKKAITSDGFCSLHYEFSNNARVPEETNELGISMYDSLTEKDHEMEEGTMERLTTAYPRREVSFQPLS